MINCLARALDKTATQYPNKAAFIDQIGSISFNALRDKARRIATSICEKGLFKKPIIIFMDENIESISALLGINYSGNFFCFLDSKAQLSRVQKIVTDFSPELVIADEKHIQVAKDAVKDSENSQVVYLSELVDQEVNEELLASTMNEIIDTDIFSVIYTSGSTGEPKGAIVTHAALLDMLEFNVEYLGLSSDSVYANQCPLCFLGAYFDIFETIYTGGTNYIIPREYFSMPDELGEFIANNRINILNVTYSALTLMVGYDVFRNHKFNDLKRIIQGGGPLDGKTVYRIKEVLPDIKFYNVYGTSECMCRYIYCVKKDFKDDDAIPVGFPYSNTRTILMVDEKIAEPGETGELYISGLKGLMGYYNDKELTDTVFVNNPLNDEYVEKVYKTGDLAKINEEGALVILGRNDNQFKHHGYRVNATEIERCASILDNVNEVCCLFDSDNEKIWLFYSGNEDSKAVRRHIHKELPPYMLPEEIVRMDMLPRNANSKIDRMKLKSLMK